MRSLPKRVDIPEEEALITTESSSSQAMMFYTFEDVVENFNMIGPRKKILSGQSDPILELKSCFNFKNDKICVGTPQKLSKKIKSKSKLTGRIHRIKTEGFTKLAKPLNKGTSIKFQKNGSEESKTTSSSVAKNNLDSFNRSNRLAKKTTFSSSSRNSSKSALLLKEPEIVDKKINDKRGLIDQSKDIKNSPQATGMKRRKRESFSPPKFCFNCNWHYPEELTIIDINSHINLCIDGMGEQSMADLLSQITYKSEAKGSKSSILKINEISYPICKHYKKKKSNYA